MKRSFLIISLVICCQLVFAQYAKSFLQLKVVDWGLIKYDSIHLNTKDDSLLRSTKRVFNAVVDKRTDTIEAKIGNVFGVFYTCGSYFGSEEIKVEWVYPNEVKGEKSHVSYRNILLRKVIYNLYIFEIPDELVKGDWFLRIYHHNKLLLEKKFIII